jgi:hypothetical protein
MATQLQERLPFYPRRHNKANPAVVALDNDWREMP